jgi:uncharacterized protein (DUF305 family)
VTHLRKIAAALATGALLLPLAACGDDSAGEAHARQTAANGDVFNGVDVDFATAMTPHHSQALAMVDLTRDRDLTPEVEQLTEQIRTAQAPEIEQMVDWLTAWDEPVPATMRDHAHAHAESGDTSGDGMQDDEDMPGMMSEDDMNRLESSSDQEFEDVWLEMMIEHHKGAIEMAEQEQAGGIYRPATKLAGSIIASQRAEIDHMQQLLDA